MTNYVEKMMETAVGSRCYFCGYRLEACGSECDSVHMPDFTAEKQLEIIKLIGDFRLYRMDDGTFDLRGQYLEVNDEKGDFIQALAQLTTKLMSEGKLDKQKVKEILQG